MKKWLMLALAISTFVFSGCASHVMKVPITQNQKVLDKNKSYIDFYGTAYANGIMYYISEFNLQEEDMNLVCVMFYDVFSPLIKCRAEVNPGEHYYYLTLYSPSENDDLLKITTEAGRIYDIYVEDRIGVFRPRVYFHPLTVPQYFFSFASETQEELDAYVLHTPSATGFEYFNDHKGNYIKDTLKKLPKWIQEKAHETEVRKEQGRLF